MMEEDRIARLRVDVARTFAVSPPEVRVVRSPYRVCFLGAHVDHQLGEVTGMALDRSLLLGFSPRADSQVHLESRNFPGGVKFSVDDVPPRPIGDWGDYARGAAYALRAGRGIRNGLCGIVDGYENAGGLSSSAAVGVAYLLALERANGLDVPAEQNIELDRVIENDYIGLNNGLLDQSTILLSRRGRLMCLDCESGRTELHECGAPGELWIVSLFSGLSVQLSDTDYNRRVAECEEAARLLLHAAGQAPREAPKLRHVPREAFDRFKGTLAQPLRRRAEHFFSEQRRVREGVRLWREGDLEGVGRLVSQSGQSSVENYECGNRYLRSAFAVLRETPGVLGARFSGAGFRGCSIGIMAHPPAPGLADEILARYLAAHPDMEGRADVTFCRSADGAGMIDDETGPPPPVGGGND